MKKGWLILGCLMLLISVSVIAFRPAHSQNPRTLDTSISLQSKIKIIADSTRAIKDSIVVNKLQTSQVLDSAKLGNQVFKAVNLENKKTGQKIDQVIRLVTLGKSRVTVNVQPKPAPMVIFRDSLPEIKVDSIFIPKPHLNWFERIFKGRQ